MKQMNMCGDIEDRYLGEARDASAEQIKDIRSWNLFKGAKKK